jgi:hypothetical protein
MGMLTLQGRALAIQPFEVTQLSREGQWDQTSLLESIRKNEFSAIIIFEAWSGERWTPEMRAVINQSYILVDDIGGNKVYFPRMHKTQSLAACPGAVWQLPGDGSSGVKWNDGGLDFFGQGQEGKIPVYAVADGLLTRRADWLDSIVILHDDPLNPGTKTWSYYSGMGTADGTVSFIVPDFPSGVENMLVKAGQIIGYEGTWSGKPLWASWVHVHFVLLDGPDPLDARTIDPVPYLNLSLMAGDKNQQELKCLQP